jgi:predicted ester cyclase
MSVIKGNPQEEKNKNIIKSYIDEIFNKHNLTLIERYFGGNSIEGSPQAGKGGVGSKQFLNEFFRAFPDWCASIEHIVAENNLVVVFLRGSGTHKGEFNGIPPTNKLVSIRSAELYKIVNKRITGHWYVMDQLNLLKQIGALLSENVNKELMDANVVWIHDYEEESEVS